MPKSRKKNKKKMKIPFPSISVLIFSLVWLFIAIRQWVFDFPDISSLIFGIGFFFIGLFVSYALWFNKNIEEKIDDMNKDIQAIDKKCNDLEVKIIDLNRGLN